MRMRTAALAATFLLAAGTAALADDPMANTYGNTVTTKSHKTGATGTLYFDSNMSYTARGMDAKGGPVTYPGSWALKDGGGTICLTPHIPNANPPPPTTCSPLQKHAVGDNWTTTNDVGETFDVSLSAGR
ncbi:MAG: hypothetical protein ACREHE_00755 [Rhizomicrobium sp.]